MFNINKTLVNDIGQVHYMVDSNFRTVAQGWSRADHTGPLDLFGVKNPGYVFYGPGAASGAIGSGGTDASAIQAAIDAMVDFRGDTLFFTPGNYSIGTALVINVPDARYMGPKVHSPRVARATLTDTVGDHSFAAAADRNELAYLRFVPLTAQNFFTNVSGADGGHIHHCYYDAAGVAASTSTEFFLTVATTQDWLVEQCVFEVDAAQGDIFTFVGAQRWKIQDCAFYVTGPTITWASVMTFVTTASQGMIVQRCHFGSGGGANGLITNVFTGMAGGSILKVLYCTLDGTSTPTATNIETGFDATVGIELAENYITGDATTQGGLLIVLA